MTIETPKVAFEPDLVTLPLKSLLPVKHIANAKKASGKFRTIAKSIAEVGIIEPLVVYHKPDKRGRYLLLDGHLRREILLGSGIATADCLLATDDEAYTYNKQVSRLGAVQEHLLIIRAIERGVSESKIAKALGVDIARIRQRQHLLDGITARAIILLKDRVVNPTTFSVLRKMKPARQVEACELMIAGSNFSLSYARAMLAASDDAQLIKARRRKRFPVVTSADLSLMERELQDVRKKLNVIEVSYARDMLDLVVAARYVSDLLARQGIACYLDDNHPELAREFRAIITATLVEPQKRIYSRKKAATEERARVT